MGLPEKKEYYIIQKTIPFSEKKNPGGKIQWKRFITYTQRMRVYIRI